MPLLFCPFFNKYVHTIRETYKFIMKVGWKMKVPEILCPLKFAGSCPVQTKKNNQKTFDELFVELCKQNKKLYYKRTRERKKFGKQKLFSTGKNILIPISFKTQLSTYSFRQCRKTEVLRRHSRIDQKKQITIKKSYSLWWIHDYDTRVYEFGPLQ